MSEMSEITKNSVVVVFISVPHSRFWVRHGSPCSLLG